MAATFQMDTIYLAKTVKAMAGDGTKFYANFGSREGADEFALEPCGLRRGSVSVIFQLASSYSSHYLREAFIQDDDIMTCTGLGCGPSFRIAGVRLGPVVSKADILSQHGSAGPDPWGYMAKTLFERNVFDHRLLERLMQPDLDPYQRRRMLEGIAQPLSFANCGKLRKLLEAFGYPTDGL